MSQNDRRQKDRKEIVLVKNVDAKERPGATLRHVRGKEVSQSRESHLDVTHLPVPDDFTM